MIPIAVIIPRSSNMRSTHSRYVEFILMTAIWYQGRPCDLCREKWSRLSCAVMGRLQRVSMKLFMPEPQSLGKYLSPANWLKRYGEARYN
jgi:hypothetical protein